MSVTLLVAGVMTGFIVVPMIIWFIFWTTSFRYPVTIHRQVGETFGNTVEFDDKFKVREKDGHHVIIFKRQMGGSQSFPGEFWTKVFKNKSQKFTDDQWHSMLRSGKISRKLHLYQTTEGEFHPIGIGVDKEGKPTFKVLPQDNRAYLVNRFKKNNEMTMDSRKQLIVYLAITGGFLMLVVAFVLWLVYMTESAANICGVAGPNFISTAQGVVGG